MIIDMPTNREQSKQPQTKDSKWCACDRSQINRTKTCISCNSKADTYRYKKQWACRKEDEI